MKWAVLVLALLMVPVLVGWLRTPRNVQWAAFAMGFLPFVITSWRLYTAPYSWPLWPGATKGLELTALDFLAVALLLSTRRKISVTLVPWWLYLIAVAVTVPMAQQQTAAVFYVWQIARMMVVYMAAAQLVAFPGTTDRLLHGVIAGVIYQACFAVWQYSHGDPQPGGAFGAQNLLGLMSNFALVPSLAVLLVQRGSRWAVAGVAGGLLLDFLTASRATLGLAALGLLAMLIFSCAKNMTGRKGAIFGAILFGSLIIGPLALRSMSERRSAESIESSNAERDAFKRAAWMIIGDYPFGTGANQYVLVANLGGYDARAGVIWNSGSRGTNVHNSYLLVMAETGVVGLLAMAFLILLPIVRGIRVAYRLRGDRRSEILLGFTVAMLVFAIHLLFEWAWVLYLTQYMFAMYAGVTVGLVAQMRANAVVGGGRKLPEPTVTPDLAGVASGRIS